ncbi:MAG: MATE family efflux transporter [Opitutales bacterium]|nr:MATE family efflux transporter [Opitutales bacterium]
MNKQENEMAALEHAPILPLLIKYSLPAIGGMIVYSLYNVVDSIFIGRWIGAAALAALAIAFPVMNLIFAIGTLVGIGGASVCSIRLGEKKTEEAHAVLGNVLLLSLITGFGFGWGACLFLGPILKLFGAGAETFQPAYEFMLVTLLTLPITFCFFNLNHMMRASGYPQKAMYSLLISVVINIVLAPIFIYICGWGMIGAALATAIAQLFSLVWVLVHLLNPKHVLHFRRGIFRLQADVTKSILAIGLSPCMMNVCGCLVVIVINHELLKYSGDTGVAAYGILCRVVMLIAMVVNGITQGMQPIAGFNHGAGRTERVVSTLRYGMLAGTVVTTLGWGFCVFFPQLISNLFTTDTQLLAATDEALRMSCYALPVIGMQIVIGNFFQAIGRAKLAILLSMTRQMLILIPLLLILPRFLETRGVWLSMPISDTVSWLINVVCILFFLRDYSAVPADVAGTRARQAVEEGR